MFFRMFLFLETKSIWLLLLDRVYCHIEVQIGNVGVILLGFI